MVESSQYLSYLATVAPTITLAFSFGIRKFIGRRDSWTCQWTPCEVGKDGQPARYQDGFMVQAAHFDHDQNAPWYDSPDNGRILCLAHHALDEAVRGNEEAFRYLSGLDPFIKDVAQNPDNYPWLPDYQTVLDVIYAYAIGDTNSE